MKKKIFAIAVIAACLAVMASGTLAYFNSVETAHNVITSGGIAIAIEEYQEDGSSYPTEEIEIMPGMTVSKIVIVRSLDEPSFVRAKFTVDVLDANKNKMDLDDETLKQIIGIAVGESWSSKEGEDWWYYNAPVPTGEATAPLFSEVVFDGPNMTNEYQNATVKIFVKAEAVQADNNGETALEAKGWPEGDASEESSEAPESSEVVSDSSSVPEE